LSKSKKLSFAFLIVSLPILVFLIWILGNFA
jgi:hypothetical protein